MGAAATEFNNGPAFGRDDAAGSFGSDHRLENKSGEQICFHQLRFDQRGAHNGNGFVGKDRCAFRQCKQIACETELGQELKKFTRSMFKLRERAKVINLVFAKLEFAQIFDGLRQSGGDQEIARLRQAANR